MQWNPCENVTDFGESFLGKNLETVARGILRHIYGQILPVPGWPAVYFILRPVVNYPPTLVLGCGGE